MFEAMNDLERAIEASRRGEMDEVALVGIIAASALVVPTVNEVKQDGSDFMPLIYTNEGVSMMAAFSDKERAKGITSIAKYLLVMNGLEVLHRIPRDLGIVINPSLPIGLELPPNSLSKIRIDFPLTSTNNGE